MARNTRRPETQRALSMSWHAHPARVVIPMLFCVAHPRVPHEVLVLEQRLWAGANCSTLVLKLVNLLPGQLNLTVSIAPQPSRRAVAAKVSVLTGGLDDQNSFAEPFKVAPRESVVELELEPQSAGGPAGFMLQLPGNSLPVALLEGAAPQQ